MKDFGFQFLVIIGIALLIWFYRGCEKDKEWETKLKEVPTDTTRHRDTVWVKLPADSGIVKAVIDLAQGALLTAQELKRVNEIIRMSKDSLQAEVLRLLRPKKIAVKSDRLGEFIATFYPLGDSLSWIHYPAPERVITNTVEITKFVTIEKHRPWWEIPAAVIVGGLAAFGLSQIHR